MKIREATTSDLADIARIWNYYIEETSYNYDYTPKSMAYFEDWLASREIPVFVIEEDNNLAGYGYYGQFRGRDGYLHSAEHGLYFDHDAQGKGLGTALMNFLEADAKKRGFHVMVAGIDSSNPGSIRFHEKLGYEHVGTFKEIGYKNGEWLDCVFLQKIL
ncbi:N-acetyltransferase family protein [Jiulongibacter sp. NS-SX5]|uniref:N-acetyltransferase family protein n=1 Tax=Jiulongibacter sp. NS-SX5 TaxID=3463854 RepID=UPI004058C56F